MLPILIGSNALKQYGFKVDSNADWDLIVNDDLAKNFELESTSKQNNICWFNQNKADLLIIKKDSSDELIFNKLNEMENKKIIKFIKFDVIVAPLEILYVIKKSHIHRILPLLKNNIENATIWHKQMNYYIEMRNKLGYNRMDEIIYGDKKYGNPIEPNTYDENSLNRLMLTVFIKRFDETNKMIGDTKISMNKKVGQFFDDNIQRFIEHDELHKKVGKLCRNSEEQLFHRFQKDKNYANLDYELFFGGKYEDRIQLFREEIIVLFLERKVIPELMLCYKKENVIFEGFNKFVKEHEFNEIVAHFVTNLCDNGHSWLRQYLLDHYTTYYNFNSYNYNDIFDLAIEIADIKNYDVVDNDDETVIQNKKYLKKYFNFKNQKLYTREIDCNNNNENNITKRIVELDCYSQHYYLLNLYNYCEEADYHFEQMSNDLIYFNNDDNDKSHIFYCMHNNYGIILKEYECESFTLQLSHNKDKNNLIIYTNYDKKEYNKRYKKYYYYSYPSSCGDTYDSDYDWNASPRSCEYQVKYLSSFGECDKDLENFVEKLARVYLQTPEDDTFSGAERSSDSCSDGPDSIYNDFYSDDSDDESY